MLPRAVHLDPISRTCSSLGQQDLDALLSRDPRSGNRSHLTRLHSCPSRPQSVSHPPETRSVYPGQPCRLLPASRRTRTFLPRNSDTGLASALHRLLACCLRAESSSWTPLRPLSATGLPGTVLQPPGEPLRSSPWSTSSLGAHQTLHVVEVDWSPPSPHHSPHPCAGRPGVVSCCCHHLQLPVSPRVH